MSDKSRYSLSRAISSMLNRGTATGLELEYHLQTARDRANDKSLAAVAYTGRPGMGLHVPLFMRQVSAGGDGASLVGRDLERTLDLLEWSACRRAGAQFLTGLSSNLSLARTLHLSEPEWIPELGFAPSTDPGFGSVQLSPKRLSAMINVSRQLVIQGGGEELNAYLLSGLTRALSNQLDQIALYGSGPPAVDAPIGILGNPNTLKLTYDWNAPNYTDLTEFERRVELQDVGVNSFGYIFHPTGRKILRDTERFGAASGGTSIWESITRPQSSMVVREETDIFFGAFNMMTIGVWGDSADIVIDNYSLAATGTIRIVCSLYADVALTLAPAFGIARETPPPPPPLQVKVRESEPPVTAQPVPPKTAPVAVSEPPPPPPKAELDERGNKKGFRTPFK